ncbi:MAG: BPSS1780 family membrane protein [Sedimenticola sp.]|nr:BPSS1780 family membrane protein [Sedimenticola sp.]
MGELYRVIYTGQLRLGTEKKEAIASFSTRFKVSEEKARKVLSSSKDLVLKKDLEKSKAEKYQQALEAIGMIVRIEPLEQKAELDALSLVPIDGAADKTKSDAPVKENKPVEPVTPTCPKCGSDRLDGDNCLACGIVIPKYLARQAAERESGESAADNATGPVTRDPYAAPEADLVRETVDGELTDPIGHPAGAGWHWITRGFWHFKQNPVAWILTMVVWVVLSIVVSFIPFVGSLAITLFSPVVLAGFMLGCAAQDHGEDFELSHLFAGFSSSVGQLVLVGLLYLAGFFIIGIIIAMVGGGVMIGMMGGMEAMENPDPTMMSSTAGVGSVILMIVVAFGLSIPLLMAYWFAPALIAMEGLSAMAAMKLSFIGCLKNMLPFLVYGIVAIIIVFIGAIPVGLGLLVVMPVMTASVYTAYRAIYYG